MYGKESFTISEGINAMLDTFTVFEPCYVRNHMIGLFGVQQTQNVWLIYVWVWPK